MKNFSFFKITLITILNLFFITNSFAWNSTGHVLVAKIAYDRLQPDVKTKVDQIVASFSKEYSSIVTFVDMAPWPDSLHAQKIETFSRWHYIDNPISGDGTLPPSGLVGTDNVVWAISQIEPVVKNNKANVFEQGRFLAFLIHLVGDAHQPLHTVTRVTAAHPNGDRGGNDFIVQCPLSDTKMASKNLHACWDQGIGLFDNTPTPDKINMLETQITTDYPESYFADQIKDLNPQDWINEGVNAAPIYVYTTLEGKPLNAAYIRSSRDFTEQRIALAGYRLAALLNGLLGSKKRINP